MIVPVGIDFGRGSTKVVAEGISECFPSVVGRAREVRYAARGETRPQTLVIDRGNRAHYEVMVGESAIRHSDLKGVDLSKERTTRDVTALVAEALDRVPGREFAIVCGAPIRYYAKASLAYPEWLRGQWQINDRSLSVKRVGVVPEPAGALASLPQEVRGGMVALIDIGAFSTDCAMFEDGVYLEDQSFGLRIGASGLLQDLADHIYRKHNYEIEPWRLEKALQANKILLDDQSIELETYISEQVGMYGFYLVEQIKQRWEDVFDLDALLVFGGGSFLFFEQIKDWRHIATRLTNPVEANAKGFYLMAREVYGDK